MSRQQAPQPVVRPLEKIAVNGVVPLAKQAGDNGIMCIMRDFNDTNDVVGCISVQEADSALEITLIGCIKQSDETVTLVDPSVVEDTVFVRELPCYSNYVNIEVLQTAGDAAMQRFCEGTDIVPDMLIVELKEGEWADWGNRRLQYVIEL